MHQGDFGRTKELQTETGEGFLEVTFEQDIENGWGLVCRDVDGDERKEGYCWQRKQLALSTEVESE